MTGELNCGAKAGYAGSHNEKINSTARGIRLEANREATEHALRSACSNGSSFDADVSRLVVIFGQLAAHPWPSLLELMEVP